MQRKDGGNIVKDGTIRTTGPIEYHKIGLNGKKEHYFIVFAHNKNNLGQILYKFLGEFKLSEKESKNNLHVFNRTKSKIDIGPKTDLWKK